MQLVQIPIYKKLVISNNQSVRFHLWYNTVLVSSNNQYTQEWFYQITSGYKHGLKIKQPMELN